MTPAELAITKAIEEVEKIGADVRLTNAVINLSDARNHVADYIDQQLRATDISDRSHSPTQTTL
jgi:hypothetical protein